MNKWNIIIIVCIYVTVPKHGECVYEDFQFDLYDAIDRALEWLSPVPGPDAPGISCQLLGCHQWTPSM